jgi:hypothetical protein
MAISPGVNLRCLRCSRAACNRAFRWYPSQQLRSVPVWHARKSSRCFSSSWWIFQGCFVFITTPLHHGSEGSASGKDELYADIEIPIRWHPLPCTMLPSPPLPPHSTPPYPGWLPDPPPVPPHLPIRQVLALQQYTHLLRKFFVCVHLLRKFFVLGVIFSLGKFFDLVVCVIFPEFPCGWMGVLVGWLCP